MSKVGIWMPIIIGDYLKETTDLTLLEEAVHNKIRVQYWINEGPVDDNIKRLFTVLKVSKKHEKQAVLFILKKFYFLDNGKWRSDYVDKLIEEAKRKREARSIQGTNAVNVRWSRSKVRDTNSNTDSIANSNSGGITEAHTVTNTDVIVNSYSSPIPTPSPATSPTSLASTSEDSNKPIPENKYKTPYSPPLKYPRTSQELTAILSENALKIAKMASHGWDIYELMRIYVEGIPQRGVPDDYNAAFPKWCANYTKGKAP